MSEHLSLGLPTLTRRLHWQHFAAGAGLGAGGHAHAAPRLRALSDLALSLAPLSERQFLCYRGLLAHFAPSSVSLPGFQGVCSKLALLDLLRLGLSPPLRKRLRLVEIGGHLARPPSRTGAVPWARASTGGQSDTAFTARAFAFLLVASAAGTGVAAFATKECITSAHVHNDDLELVPHVPNALVYQLRGRLAYSKQPP